MVYRNCEFCCKFTLAFRKNFYLERKINSFEVRNLAKRCSVMFYRMKTKPLMKEERKIKRRNYENNLQSFINNLNGSFLELISFISDNDPTYDKYKIPFKFEYCFSIRITTDKTNFDIQTSSTHSCIETFWVTESSETKLNLRQIKVSSKINNVEFENGIDNYPFKIKIECENSKFIIYAAEIYDTISDDFDYKINDEMLLLFDNEKDADIFEKIISVQKNGNK